MKLTGTKWNGSSRGDFVVPMTLAGFFLGLGAPLGYFVYSFLFLNPDPLGFPAWCRHVLDHQAELLAYLTIPTVIVFSLFGCANGFLEWKLTLKTRRIEEFMQVLSHDIKSPITAIKGAVNILQEEIPGPLNGKQREYADMISRQSRIIQELAEELLDIHRMESGKDRLNLEETDLPSLANRAVDEMRMMIDQKPARVRIVSKLEGKTAVHLDPFRIRQVFRNLISNAVKFVPAEGMISIHLFRNVEGSIEVTVSNDGPHIPEDKLEMIFDKFVQSKIRDYKLGHGLGLSICKNIMDLHGGKIWAENVDPTGVRFHIRFPSADQPV